VALIHGCTQGPTGWEQVQEILSARGFDSIAVDLAPAQFDDAGAIEFAHEVSRQIGGRERVVLASTSCSGLLAPVVAELRPIERLVYVCAGLPDIGRSATAQVAEDGVLRSDWAEVDFDASDLTTAQQYMFHDCVDDRLDRALASVRLFHPLKVYDEITPLRAYPDAPSTYVLGVNDRIIDPEWARRAVRIRLGIEPIEIGTGHCPQNSQPELLAGILAASVGEI
jgi:pimeloyl-ACP methyl ester carboxylesterase